MMQGMMGDGSMSGMMWGMGLFGLLALRAAPRRRGARQIRVLPVTPRVLAPSWAAPPGVLA
jgi:hypothetical protein